MVATAFLLQLLAALQGTGNQPAAVAAAPSPFLPNIIPATRTNESTNESTEPPEGPAAGHLRATNLSKSASADREGQV